MTKTKSVKSAQPVQKFRTQYDDTYEGVKGEKNDMESLTVPDDCLSLRQLMINHTRGIGGTAVHRAGIFTGDAVAPRDTDLTDTQARIEALKQQQKVLGKELVNSIEDAEQKFKEKAAKSKAGKNDNDNESTSQSNDGN